MTKSEQMAEEVNALARRVAKAEDALKRLIEATLPAVEADETGMPPCDVTARLSIVREVLDALGL